MGARRGFLMAMRASGRASMTNGDAGGPDTVKFTGVYPHVRSLAIRRSGNDHDMADYRHRFEPGRLWT